MRTGGSFGLGIDTHALNRDMMTRADASRTILPANLMQKGLHHNCLALLDCPFIRYHPRIRSLVQNKEVLITGGLQNYERLDLAECPLSLETAVQTQSNLMSALY